MLALRVSALDRLFGQTIDDVHDLLHLQSVVLSRQESAQRAIEAAASAGAGWPSYLIDPLSALSCWPLPYAETRAEAG